MNPNDHWRGPGGAPQGEQAGQQQGRGFGGFGTAGQSQIPTLPPPPGPSFHHPQPSVSHSLSIADLTQGPQNQHQYNTQPPPSHPANPMTTALNHQVPHQSPPQYMNRERELRDIREREMRDHELREREMRERSSLEMQRQQQEEMIMREQRDAREREQVERMHREQQQQRPVQSHTGSIPIHQPVASKVQNTIHGPNGLLSNGGSGPGPAQQTGAPPSTGPSLFSIHSQAPEPSRQPQYMQHQPVQPPPSQPGQPFMGGPSPMAGQAQLSHGQQPILNDALSYLDQVKVRFSDHPDVYNRFLDIMKDFKSQAIDTPGVIERVSNLFNGHPALIQGFNTFLPPGYRIECGTDENPDAIRVTTPSGTMTQSLQSRPFGQIAAGRQDAFEARHGWGQTLGQQISPGSRPAQLPGYDHSGQPANIDRQMDPDTANAMHQQEQRGVSQLQNAVSAATNGIARPAQASPGPPGALGQAMFPQANNIFGMQGTPDPKRGPVEFNHAISYVNKIKNRFAQQPDIYKQFLEILQTYQRESKPIGDVYAQVTQLFRDAPDLLEDFKQFLPESAAHAKQAAASARAAQDEAAMNSNIRGEPGYGTGQIAQAQTPRPAAKMPPMGQFDPPSTSKENKKRRGGPGGTALAQGPQSSLEAAPGVRGGVVQVPNANKRQKITSQRIAQADAPMVSPTLIPQLPEPLPPFPALNSTQEELGFFDRAKKFIANRASYAEFMKLINLFSNDLIDKYTLVDRVGSFLGGNQDLLNWFTTFLGVEEQDEIMEARTRIDPGRVNLSHCRAYGPSYRHLPKRDQNKPCKGRDAMCSQVLNDIWASHPTWASEDSGFIAHRKNQYEEAMHRIEEERHDYDFHIEACQRTIQLMEPIVQQFKVMSEGDLASFQLAGGFGGASEAIPKRIIMKVYGREYGDRVMKDLFRQPTLVLPIVLDRLKKKLEEWKQAQREWDRIWREQIHKNFWKSLDHQGINAKVLDKKQFQQKTLTSEIQARYEESKRNREAGMSPSKHQLEYHFDDNAVLLDAVNLILVGLEIERTNYNITEQIRIASFLKDFVASFFDIPREQLNSTEREPGASNGDGVNGHLPPMGDTSDALISLNDRLPPSTLKRGDSMRRGLFERQMGGREGSAVSTSRASTPAAAGMSETEMEDDAQPLPEHAAGPPQPWLKMGNHDTLSPQYAVDESREHTTFSLYANANVYCFFRLFEMLYSRLLAIKVAEPSVHEAVARWEGEGGRRKAAIELRMIDKGPEDFFNNIGPGADYYSQLLRMCQEVVAGSLEMTHLEETLRRYYNRTGWQLYTVDKLISAVIRFIGNMMGNDAKDKSLEILNLFFKDRSKPDTNRAQEVQYRKQAEKFSKDGEVYRICFTPSDKQCTIRLFPPEDSTFDTDDLSEQARWQYYVASYPMREPTEGVDLSRMHAPFLKRNIATQNADVEASYQEVYGKMTHYDEQKVIINPDNYRLIYSNAFMFSRPSASKKEYEVGKIEESEPFVERFVRNTTWMKDKPAEYVERRKAVWEQSLREGLVGFEERVEQRVRRD